MKQRFGESGLRTQYESSPGLERIDFTVESDPGIHIGVRSVRVPRQVGSSGPILLVHGARAPSIPSFDLDVSGGSLAADLATAGHPVFLMDLRNYGNSTREPAMNQPPESSPPITRSEHAIRDIFAVVEHIREMLRVQQVAALGWATGAQWLAHYAAACNHAISHLILFNALWPMAGDWPIGDALEDPEQPGQLKPGALACYGYASAESLLARWNDSIPAQEHDSWRDPAVSAAYARSAISSDPSSIERDPPSIRTPLGAMADSFLLSKGHRLFEPKQITARVLVFRSGLDFWSRPMDLRVAERELTNATNVECIELPDATHFAHLDRPERGRAALIDAILRSMRGQSAG